VALYERRAGVGLKMKIYSKANLGFFDGNIKLNYRRTNYISNYGDVREVYPIRGNSRSSVHVPYINAKRMLVGIEG